MMNFALLTMNSVLKMMKFVFKLHLVVARCEIALGVRSVVILLMTRANSNISPISLLMDHPNTDS